MERSIFGVLEIITAVVRNTMACTQITNHVIMTPGARQSTTVVPRVIPTESQSTKPQRILNPILLQRKSLLSMTSFETLFALKLDSPLKPSIAFGKMLRETSRSESRVE